VAEDKERREAALGDGAGRLEDGVGPQEDPRQQDPARRTLEHAGYQEGLKNVERLLHRYAEGPLAPRGEICHLGGMFTPSFTPRGEQSLLFRRMEGQTDNFTPKG
jgi:hypothetical protein